MATIVFRADASPTIGAGHVMRCLTLARAFRDRGARVAFVSIELPEPLAARLCAQDIRLLRIANMDADTTRVAIATLGEKPDWLVVDHYGLDRTWEQALRSTTRSSMVIDDLANRVHECDLLLDQNLVADGDSRYDGKLPSGGATLLGPEFALLQPVYAELHREARTRHGRIGRILVSFGGADAANLTGRTLAALRRVTHGAEHGTVAIDVVMSASAPHLEAVRRACGMMSNVTLHVELPTLAPLMAQADLAVGAGGATSWERLCLRLPALVVTLAENQRPIAAELDRRRLVRWIGEEADVTDVTIASAVDRVLHDGVDETWATAPREIDGRGVWRVYAAMTAKADTPLRARTVTVDDEERLLVWANDPMTRRSAFTTESISTTTHARWFAARLADVEAGRSRFFIVETHDGAEVGQVRCDRHDAEWEIHYAMAPVFRGRGLGARMLATALTCLKDEAEDVVVVGRVKTDNPPSRRVFELLGFDMQSPDMDNVVTYRRTL